MLTVACGSGTETDVAAIPTTDARAGLKIPVTTRSDEALDLYLEGRRLSDRLRAPEARSYYLDALQEDRHFALAHLALATSSTSAREFFEAMERALALSEVISDGERLMILALDAGVRGEAAEQLEHMTHLVELYPDDERAHNALAVLHAARQEYELAIGEFQQAIEIAPDFSPPYNQLGYVYRTLGRYDEAEAAFVKYLELIPDEPNPYDSYAELLMKNGRFEESIVNYEKALAIKPDFLFSFIGIGHNLIFLGRADEARQVFDRMYAEAPSVDQRRTALLWKAMSHVYEGNPDKALAVSSERFALAEEDDDPVSMAGDRVLMGQILLESGDTDRALKRFIDSVQLVGTAGVPDDFTANTQRNFLYWKARVALKQDRLDDARAELTAYREQVEQRQVPFELRRLHELDGELALAGGDSVAALESLRQANQQDPRILLLTAQAHQAAGNLEEARKFAAQAAHYNGLVVGYAFVREPALSLLEALEASAG